MFLGRHSILIHFVSSRSCSSPLLSSVAFLAILSEIMIPTPPPLLLVLFSLPICILWLIFGLLFSFSFRWWGLCLLSLLGVAIVGFLFFPLGLWRWLLQLWFLCFSLFFSFSFHFHFSTFIPSAWYSTLEVCRLFTRSRSRLFLCLRTEGG